MARRTLKQVTLPEERPQLVWHSAAYTFHSYAYRDPRSAFASGIGLPVVSPTTALLGVISTLFSIGDADSARGLMTALHHCEVIIDAPDGIVFFRAFHQLRRYRTTKWGPDPRYGFTTINQGTREYGLVDGCMTLYIGTPEEYSEAVKIALINLRHLGTSDSLCSLQGNIQRCDKPETVLYAPFAEFVGANYVQAATMVMLSRFVQDKPTKQTLPHWKMSGDADDTEIIPYVIPGSFQGTTRGRLYRKRTH